MAKSLEDALEERDRKVIIVAKKLVRSRGITVPHSIESLDELNELISEDRLQVVDPLDGGGPDKFVQIYENGEVERQKRVYIVDDEIFVD